MNKKLDAYFLAQAGMLAALGGLFSLLKLAIGTGIDASRFAPVNVPILLAGVMLGPVGGALVGFSADVLGCFLCGYVFNPLVNLGAILVGATCGFVYRACGSIKQVEPLERKTFLGWVAKKTLLWSVIAGHLVGSVIVKTAGLMLFYGSPKAIIVERAIVYSFQTAIDYYLVKKTLGLLK